MYGEKELVIDTGIVIRPEKHFFYRKNPNTIKKLLIERTRDIERYIAQSTYYDRDFMPHDGKYYNRKKWLKKVGGWNYD